MFDELLQRVELRPRGDVVPPAVELADLVVFHIVSFGFVPVSYGERISTWRRQGKCFHASEHKCQKDFGVCGVAKWDEAPLP